MPGLLHRNRSLVRRGRAVVVASEACRSRCCGGVLFWRATPCRICGDEGETPMPLYVATTTLCGLGEGGGENVGGPIAGYTIKVGGVCYTVDRSQTYRLCEDGEGEEGGGEGCIPPDARVLLPGATVECYGSCSAPQCLSRYYEGTPCDPEYAGPRVFLECIEGCIFATRGPDCFRFGYLNPLPTLPEGAVLLTQTDISPPHVTTCCQCQANCNPLDLAYTGPANRQCLEPIPIRCCCPPLDGACVTVRYRLELVGSEGSALVRQTEALDGTFCPQPGGPGQLTVTGNGLLDQVETPGFPSNDLPYEFTADIFPSCPPWSAISLIRRSGYTDLCPQDADVVSYSLFRVATCTRLEITLEIEIANDPAVRFIRLEYSEVVTGTATGPCNGECEGEVRVARGPARPVAGSVGEFF